MIKLLSDGTEVKFSITMFPDGTSQVWKVDSNALSPGGDNVILWLFESENELMHVCQLAQLLQKEYDNSPDLRVPYLPYGRQDKDISNHSSFALQTFKHVIYRAGISRIETFDPHSDTDMIYMYKPVKEFHKSIFNHDVVCFPDKGARHRYLWSFEDIPLIYCEKVRNQDTGEITGLKVIGGTPDTLFNKRVLIVDDICDGGMTFIKVAQALKEFNPKQIDLAVSHGLFSKGRNCLHDAGITDIYTTNSLLSNPEGFRVW